MMKKLLSIMLTVCMLLSMLVLPGAVQAVEADPLSEGTEKVKITFYENGTWMQQISVDKGSKVDYNSLRWKEANYNYDYTWSLDPNSYVGPPLRPTESIKVYLVQNPVISFENYRLKKIGSDGVSPNTWVTDRQSHTGNKSIVYRNYNIYLIYDVPENWESESVYKNYYQYNETSDKWEKITDATAPEFVSGKFAKAYEQGVQNNRINLGLITIGQINTAISYKVSFKYLATKNNNAAVAVVPFTTEGGNLWTYYSPQGYKQGNNMKLADAKNNGYTIPAGDTGDEWKTAEMYVKLSAGANYLLHLKVQSDTTLNTNEIYFDDVTIEPDYTNTPKVVKHNVYNADTGKYGDVVEVATSDVVELGTPVGAPEGEDFLGWYTSEDGEEKVTSVPAPSSTNPTTLLVTHVYAKYGVPKPTVHFVQNGSEIHTASVESGEPINYSALKWLAPDYNYDHVWSLDPVKYVAPPPAITEDITVHALQNPVLSFENYKGLGAYTDDAPKLRLNTQLSTNYHSGNTSIKYRNYDMALLDVAPDNWENVYTDYYQYNETLDKWEKIPAGAEHGFVANKYAKSINPNHLSSALIPIREFKTSGTTVNYKVSFKYLTTTNNSSDAVVSYIDTSSSNIWDWSGGGNDPKGLNANGGDISNAKPRGFTIPAGSTEGNWKTGELYISGTFGSYHSKVLMLKIFSDKTQSCTNEIYFDDITIEPEYTNTPKVVMHNIYNAETGKYDITEEIPAEIGKKVLLGTPATPEGLDFLGWSMSENGTDYVSSVTIPDGTNPTSVCAINVYANYGKLPSGVTFVYDEEKSTRVKLADGATINYTSFPLTADFNYDYVWSAKQDSYEKPPATVNGHVTVYAYQNPVLSFENYKGLGQYSNASLDRNVQVSSTYHATGKNSIRFRDFDLQLLTKAPDNWSTNYSDYYEFDTDSQEWVSVQAGQSGAPNFDLGVYATKINKTNWMNGNFIAIGTVPKGTAISYKVSFKYLTTEKNTTDAVVSFVGVHNNGDSWNHNMKPAGLLDGLTAGQIAANLNGMALSRIKDYGVTIPAGDTGDEWKTAELVISGTMGGWETTTGVLMLKIFSEASGDNDPGYTKWTNDIYIDDITIEPDYKNTPSITKHNYYENGDLKTEKMPNVEAGKEYPLGTPEAPAGKYFMGWYTSEDGTENITTVDFSTSGNPTAVAAKNVYAKYGTYVDGNTYNFESAVSTNINGLNGVNIRETGNEGNGRSYTADGLILGIASSMQYGLAANKFDPDATSFAQATDITKEYLASDVYADLGETIKVGWDGRYDSYVIRDRNGAAAVPKANTKYAAVVTYKKIGNGNVNLSFLAGRKTATIGSAVGSATDISSSVDSKSLSDIQKGVEYLTQTFELTTGDYADEIPVFSLHASFDGYLAQRVDTTDVMTVGGKTYYPYKVVDRAQILIKEITIIEVGENNSALTFNYYEKGVGYSAIIKDAEVGTPIDVSTKIVDTNWYREQYKENALIPSRITTYPADSAVLYNAAYMMANGAEGYYYANNTKNLENDPKLAPVTLKEGDEEIYALKYESDTAVTNDYNVFRLGEVKADTTYKLTYRYKTDSLSDKLDVSFLTASAPNALVKANLTLVESIEEEKDGWVEVTQYFTADPIGKVLDDNEIGIDYTLDTFNYDELFVKFQQEEAGKNRVYFADFNLKEIDDVITGIGAAILEKEDEDRAGHQALRYFFEYKTENGTDITVDGKPFTVVERGFLYRNGRVELGNYVAGNYFANIENSNVIKKSITSNFENCWQYDDETDMMQFSTYVFNFDIEGDTRKLEVKAYLVIQDEEGNKYYIHSASVNRTVDGVRAILEGEGADNTRQLVWSEEFDQDSVSELTSFHQNYAASDFDDENINVVEGESNFFVKDGKLVLRVKKSDGDKVYDVPKLATTRDRMSFRYGRLVMRAKVPSHEGMWSSFWMQPDPSAWNAGDYTGEIDIFETYGNVSLQPALHRWYRDAETGLDKDCRPSDEWYKNTLVKPDDVVKPDDAYHTFALEWTPEYLKYYIDDKLYCTMDITKDADYCTHGDAHDDGMACFHKYYYICLGNHVFSSLQGDWMTDQQVENLPDFAQYGEDFEIDYIRLYQNDEKGEEFITY